MTSEQLVRRKAFERVVTSIDATRSLPDQVFLGPWETFLFFESDRLFAPSFAVIAQDLLRVDQASACCLVNFSESPVLTYESAAKLFLDSTTQSDDYDAQLRGGGPVSGWLYGMDRYGFASEAGSWSIYCEKSNDMGVIALSRTAAQEKYQNALSALHAAPISILLIPGSASPIPFCQMTGTWRKGLTEHYKQGNAQKNPEP